MREYKKAKETKHKIEAYRQLLNTISYLLFSICIASTVAIIVFALVTDISDVTKLLGAGICAMVFYINFQLISRINNAIIILEYRNQNVTNIIRTYQLHHSVRVPRTKEQMNV